MGQAKVLIPERKCPICGKRFCFMDFDQWAYKTNFRGNRKLYCSWHCLQTAKKRIEAAKNPRGRRAF